jgi:hypothetical protein
MMYCVMSPPLKFVILFWANLIYVNDKKLYGIPETVPPTSISLIPAMKCRKVNSQIRNFDFFMIHSQNDQEVAATSMASVTGHST